MFQNFYIIPDYQREYVWTEKEVNQLLEDIYEAFDSDPKSEYFLGSVVVCKVKDTVKFEVIDGQQRLITLSLLLNNLSRVYLKVPDPKNYYAMIQRFLYDRSITDTGETISSPIIEVQYEGKEILDDGVPPLGGGLGSLSTNGK